MRCVIVLALIGLLSLLGCKSKSELNAELYKSSQKGDVVAVRRLLKQGADPNANNGDKEFNVTVLEASTSHPEVLKTLLDAGANPRLADSNGGTPLYIAAGESATSLRLLLDAGVKPDEPISGGKTALAFAADIGNIDSIELLIANGANVNNQDSLGFTPIHQTVLSSWTGRRAEAIRLLLKHGANPKLKDKRGKTALDWAKDDFYRRKPDGPEIVKILEAATKP